mgnify:CR=1 FL=1
MKKIIISPFSKKLRRFNLNEPEKDNPKNYPFWEDVVKLLRSKGYYVTVSYTHLTLPTKRIV